MLFAMVINYFFFSDGPSSQIREEAKICYYMKENVSEEDPIAKTFMREGLSCKYRIKLITPGLVIDTTYESTKDAESWSRFYERIIRRKYTKNEIQTKKYATEQLYPLFESQINILQEKYELIIQALEQSGFFLENSQKKLREGYVELKRMKGKSWKKLYCVLYKDFIYFFEPHERVSFNIRPYTIINLKFITAISQAKTLDTFVVTTPLRRFVIKTKHQVAVDQWIDKIQTQSIKKQGQNPAVKKMKKVIRSSGILLYKGIKRKNENY